MPKTIFAQDGFCLKDILSDDGVFFEMNGEFFDNDEPKFTNDINMSHDDLIKFLYMDEIDNNLTNKIVSPLGVNFNQLRANMTDLLGNGMILKLLRKRGVGEEMQENALITAKYIGYFEDQDEPFDATYNHEVSNNLQLGNDILIPGLEIALRSMKKHEISIFIIKPEYAFGKAGCPPRIPPNEDVLFLINIIDYKTDEFTTSFNKLSIEERKAFFFAEKRAEALIEKASEYFRKGNFNKAINEYTSAGKIIESARLANDEEEIRQKELLTRVYGNLAVCFNKQNKPRCACSAINQIPNPNAKSHFNHGRALIRLGEFGRALKELNISENMEPGNKMIAEEIKLIKQLESKYNLLTKNLTENSYLITAEGDVRLEFINVAKKLCQTLQNDNNVLRIILPSSLTNDEKSFITELTANYKLIVVSHIRYEKEIVFIAKPNY